MWLTKPSPFSALLGRPCLYGTKVVGDWGKKKFRFGKLVVAVLWDPNKPNGKTTHEGEKYDLDVTLALEEEMEDVMYLTNLYHDFTEEEVFGPAAQYIPTIPQLRL
ncbi:unnamed protein product [Calypogeia fissa]